jgi:imidazolonepropionase-like amidohydrolase
MRLAGAPEGIKFALGENVKQSNWGDNFTSRYPQTRMGVETIIRDRFKAAKDYQQAWQNYRKLSKKERLKTVPPRKDLELEALLEILNGKRLIHSHSYRQDEILMLCRVAREFGFKIGTFQHVLEGYKVAESIKEAAIGASTFSDWWAYKFEVYDAIPYNGALMHKAGVNVSFNSDSNELARRLNTEAAKAVKYGGLTPEEAIKFVTINPAIQLGIADKVGSLEPGKDADFVIWSGNPLSTYSICEQTWIDGRKMFDRAEDLKARETVVNERAKLLQIYFAEKSGNHSGKAFTMKKNDPHSCRHSDSIH